MGNWELATGVALEQIRRSRSSKLEIAIKIDMYKLLLRRPFFFALIVCEAFPLPIHAVDQSVLERYNCGSLGIVSLRSSKKISSASGHATSTAQIDIPSKKVKQLGVVHIAMGGNDRTFTRNIRDNYRSVDETNPANPIMMSIRRGDFFYGKHREEITLSLPSEAYTCIPLQELRLNR